MAINNNFMPALPLKNTKPLFLPTRNYCRIFLSLLDIFCLLFSFNGDCFAGAAASVLKIKDICQQKINQQKSVFTGENFRLQISTLPVRPFSSKTSCVRHLLP